MATAIRFHRDGILWRASIFGADHLGGMGETPEEALGWLCFNHPQRLRIGDFWWKSKPPKLPNPESSEYPVGMQEVFEHLETKTKESQ